MGDVDLHAGEVGEARICRDGDLGVEVVGGGRGGGVCMRLRCAVLCEGEVVCAVRGEVDIVGRDSAGVRADGSVAAGSGFEF